MGLIFRVLSVFYYSLDYNPYLVPYYVAIYTFTRTLVTMVLEIFQDKNNRNKPERIGRYYKNIKID